MKLMCSILKNVAFASVMVVAINFSDFSMAHANHHGHQGNIVVANRESGTISVIDVKTDKLLRMVHLPQGPNDAVPEPMYVVNTNSWFESFVWVGDRANDRVVVFDADTYDVVDVVPCGDGVFHMWAHPWRGQLWVVNDIDNTVTVIDTYDNSVIATIPMPADLIDAGAKPHDVVFGPFGIFAYVSFLNTPDPVNDAVVQFDTFQFQPRRRADVGEDPHLSFNWRTWELYMPCQGSDAIYVLDSITLSEIKVIDAPGAHGAITSRNGKRFYSTNLPGSGTNGVYSVNTRSLEIIGMADTPDSVPHNVALDRRGRKLYVTHSGPNNTVSVFKIKRNGQFEFVSSIEVGDNPFGLAFVR